MKLLSECVYKVAQAKFISICDAKSGFWQLLVRPDDRWKCAFVTHHGVWTWKRMPFGLQNAPATFVKATRYAIQLFYDGKGTTNPLRGQSSVCAMLVFFILL